MSIEFIILCFFFSLIREFCWIIEFNRTEFEWEGRICLTKFVPLLLEINPPFDWLLIFRVWWANVDYCFVLLKDDDSIIIDSILSKGNEKLIGRFKRYIFRAMKIFETNFHIWNNVRIWNNNFCVWFILYSFWWKFYRKFIFLSNLTNSTKFLSTLSIQFPSCIFPDLKS